MSKVKTHTVSTRISSNDYVWLKQYCAQSGVEISAFIREFIEQLRQGTDLRTVKAEQDAFQQRIIASYGKIKTMYDYVSDEVADLSDNIAENNELLNKLIDLLVVSPAAENQKQRVTYEEVEARRRAAKAAREANNT